MTYGSFSAPPAKCSCFVLDFTAALWHESLIMNAEQENSVSAAPDLTLKWLFLDLNSFFASVEQQDNLALRGRPVAVVPMLTDSTCAIAASPEAKLYGVKTGTKIYEAKKLCPGLRCVLARHDAYVDYHGRVFTELENHLHVTRICSIDEAACLLLGDERRPENAAALAGRIKDGLRRRVGALIRCSIGIAPNAFLAKVASDMQKPDGLVLLDRDNLQERLFSLRLTDLPGIGKNMERRLNRGGVFSVAQFWHLPPKQARRIWGSVEGERFWYRLRGYDIPEQETQKRVVGHSRVLDPSLRAPDKAYMMARQLIVKAAARLRRYELYARRIGLGVRSVSGMRWGGETIFAPSQDNFTFIKALEDLWFRMLDETGGGGRMLKVSVSLYDLYEREQITLDLFASGRPQNTVTSMALSQGMDAINRRYGANTISLGCRPKTAAGHVGTKIAFTRIPDAEEFRE